MERVEGTCQREASCRGQERLHHHHGDGGQRFWNSRRICQADMRGFRASFDSQFRTLPQGQKDRCQEGHLSEQNMGLVECDLRGGWGTGSVAHRGKRARIRAPESHTVGPSTAWACSASPTMETELCMLTSLSMVSPATGSPEELLSYTRE